MAKEEPTIKTFEVFREKLEKFVQKIFAHKKWVILGVLIGIGVGGAFYAYTRITLKREEVASFELFKALNANDAKERLKILNALIDKLPSTRSAILGRYLRAKGFIEEGKWDEAEKDLLQVIKKAPKPLKAGALCLLGDVLLKKNNLEEALQKFRLCQKEGSGWIESYALFKEAAVLDQMGKTQEAILVYQKLLPLLPSGEMELFVRIRLKELGAGT
jgi:predicted negative regulator of RcsB-dependent stress response